jgi:hypothetical protein
MVIYLLVAQPSFSLSILACELLKEEASSRLSDCDIEKVRDNAPPQALKSLADRIELLLHHRAAHHQLIDCFASHVGSL